MLKIQEPGSSPAVWAKNSTVLLPPQSALLTKEQERERSAPAHVCVSRKKEEGALNHSNLPIFICAHKNKVPSAIAAPLMS